MAALLIGFNRNLGLHQVRGRFRLDNPNSVRLRSVPSSADTILREAFVSAGIEGASTHSFRRTALTQMSNAGIALRVMQEISGHSNLELLQRYLEVRREKVRGAIASFSMLSYTGKLYYPAYPIDSQMSFAHF